MKLVFCAVIFAAVVAVKAVGEAEDAGVFPDYWQNDYDNFYDYPEESNDADDDSKLNIEVKQEDTDKLVDAEIQDFRVQDEAHVGSDDGEKFDALEDYQFEDNRSDSDDKDPAKENSDDIPEDEEPMPDDAPELLAELVPSENKSPEENNEGENIPGDDAMWDEVINGEVAPLPVPEEKKESSQEIQGAVEEEIRSPDDQLEEKAGSEEDTELTPIEQSDLDQIIEETNELLKEIDNTAEDDDYEEKSFEDLFAENKDDDETPQEVLNDLNSDLEKLLDTLDKLSDNDSDLGEIDENADNNAEVNDVQDYEEKYNRPYKEGNILSLRDDYENFDDSNLPDIFAEKADNDASEDDKLPNDAELDKQENVANDETNNQSSNAEISNQASTTEATKEQVEAADEAEDNDNDTDEAFDYSDEIDKLLSINDLEDDDKVDDLIDKLLRHSYGNDGLIDDQMPKNDDAEMISTIKAVSTTEAEYLTTTTENTRSTVMVDDLNSSEYNELMAQFAVAHSEDLDVNSDNFAKNVPPIHITLSVDKPTVITSPDFPNPYQVNNIVDWIIEGPGMGIEMNITHFQVNGAVGDYLLVKPGGIDASGNDGLIFSFRLKSERRYRFTNVNRMFVRFETKPGMQFFNGFSFSAKMIWPLPDIVRDEVPEPEAVIHPPRETLILSLAGLTLPNFNNVKSVFKQLIADMAEAYISEHGIEQGLNTTSEVTQITKTAVCNIRWPNYETCVEVTFGVPLHYEEAVENPRLSAEDLDDMWRNYIVKDPFAARLRELGITEYAIPNDRTVLMVWLAIALGVVISMAMLGFALWRFRCFEDYTRMMTYADTESIKNDKKNLDLYPTPHQTLPPLYSDTDYKWADDKYDDSTRVDMGGFANKSYVRDDLFDFDSDEDVITPRDRKSVISPRDVYEV